MISANFYFFRYIAVIGLDIDLIEILDTNVFSELSETSTFWGELSIFIITFVLIIKINILMEVVYEWL